MNKNKGLDKIKILMIDDEEQLTLLVKMNLERLDKYEVVIANNGEEGLAKVAKEDPDIIILDVMMPGKNGFEVLEELRRPDAKWYPVIMLTAKGALEDVKKGYDLEADHYMTKPFETIDLRRGIETILSLMATHKKEEKKEEKEKNDNKKRKLPGPWTLE